MLLAIFAASCNDNHIENYLRLQFSEYDFPATQDSLTVTVSCTGEWVVTSAKDWAAVTKNDDQSFTISVESNSTTEERTTDILVESDFETQEIMKIRQFGTRFQGQVRNFNDVITNAVMSRNGEYVAYTVSDKNRNQIPVVENQATGDTVSFPDGIQGTYTVIAVGDDGETLLLQKSPGNACLIKDGVLSELNLGSFTRSTATGMNADGSVIVGSARDAQRLDHPVYWKDGVIHELETPETDPLGKPIASRLIRIKGCSSDGRIIYGAEYQSSSYGIIYWKDDVMYTPGNDMAQIKQIVYKRGRYLYKADRACTVSWHEDMNNAIAISPNGRYLAARFIDYEYIDDETPSTELYKPACIDLESGEVTVISSDMSKAIGMAADDNGNIYAKNVATGDPDYNNCFVLNPHDLSCMSISEFFKKEYDIDFSDDRMVYAVGSDGYSFFGTKNVTYWYLHL